jgi:hypothetical protein
MTVPAESVIVSSSVIEYGAVSVVTATLSLAVDEPLLVMLGVTGIVEIVPGQTFCPSAWSMQLI